MSINDTICRHDGEDEVDSGRHSATRTAAEPSRVEDEEDNSSPDDTCKITSIQHNGLGFTMTLFTPLVYKTNYTSLLLVQFTVGVFKKALGAGFACLYFYWTLDYVK